MNNEELLVKFNAPAGARFIKQFKNGNIQIAVKAKCDRCYRDDGMYVVRVNNNQPIFSSQYNGICYKCNGAGWVWEKQTLRTEEEEAKHKARMERQRERQIEEMKRIEAEREANRKKEEEERIQREREIAEQKARSQYVGEVGERIVREVEYEGHGRFMAKEMFGYVETLIHNFRDADGNKYIWITQKGIHVSAGEKITIRGTIKAHTEYKGEKQTKLLRVKVEGAKDE